MWWDYDEDGIGPDPEGWTSWFELLTFEPYAYKPEPCPGYGACHGCLKWCDICGDVGQMCDANEREPGSASCAQHKKRPPYKPDPNPYQLSLPFPRPKPAKVFSGATDLSLVLAA